MSWYWASLVAQMVKNQPVMWETQIRSLGQEDLLEKGIATHSSILWRRQWQPTPVFLPGESQGQRSLIGCRLWGCRVRHDWSDLAVAASILAWEIPWTEKPDGLLSNGSQRVGHNWATNTFTFHNAHKMIWKCFFFCSLERFHNTGTMSYWIAAEICVSETTWGFILWKGF